MRDKSSREAHAGGSGARFLHLMPGVMAAIPISKASLAAFVLASAGCLLEPGSQALCLVGGEVFEEGSSFPSLDECNTCSCSAGEVLCTRRACAPDEVACGGRLGNICGDDEYCAYAGGDCGFADGASTCRVRPDFCPEIHAPVCGCDMQTYGNACAAAAAGTGYLSEGPCPGEGASCELGGASYPDGAGGIAAPDGCNVCFCNDGIVGCTLRLCEGEPEPPVKQ